MKKQDSENKRYLRRRKWFGAITLLLFAVVIVLLTLFFVKVLSPYMSSTEQLQAFLESYGWKGRFILLGLQVAQVLIALIPGEVIEVGAGYAYGAVEGALICLVGVAAASSLVFLLVKKWGAPLVELFISREKIQELRFINSESKLKRLVFLLFLIPGTPKDILNYLAGLTPMKVSTFVVITTLARIPSVISSTITGHFAQDGNLAAAILTYGVTAVISGVCILWYRKISKQEKLEKRQEEAQEK